MVRQPPPLEDALRERISREEKITFAAFMEMALYWPEGGYYTCAARGVGGEKAYYTAPTTHPVFGALLALQLEQMWRLLGCPEPFTVVEAGAGDGLLCRDILAYADVALPSFGAALGYVLVDRAVRGEGDGPEMSLRRDHGVHRIQAKGLPLRPLTGCILANELWDNFPVHRVVNQAGRLREIYVALEGDRFVEVYDRLSDPLLRRHMKRGGAWLKAGHEVEVNPELPWWMEEAAACLERGFLVSIDYGYPDAERYSRGHGRGTLLCYHQHSFNEEALQRIGQQDITSHVDFANAIVAGDRCGLELVGLISQAQFLQNLGFGAFRRALLKRGLQQGELYANLAGMLELIRPEGFGNYGVLVLSKGVPEPRLNGLDPHNPWRQELLDRAQTLQIPLLTPWHTPLLAQKYPHELVEVDGAWASA